jgi:hypothetical protein
MYRLMILRSKIQINGDTLNSAIKPNNIARKVPMLSQKAIQPLIYTRIAARPPWKYRRRFIADDKFTATKNANTCRKFFISRGKIRRVQKPIIIDILQCRRITA